MRVSCMVGRRRYLLWTAAVAGDAVEEGPVDARDVVDERRQLQAQHHGRGVAVGPPNRGRGSGSGSGGGRHAVLCLRAHDFPFRRRREAGEGGGAAARGRGGRRRTHRSSRSRLQLSRNQCPHFIASSFLTTAPSFLASILMHHPSLPTPNPTPPLLLSFSQTQSYTTNTHIYKRMLGETRLLLREFCLTININNT